MSNIPASYLVVGGTLHRQRTSLPFEVTSITPSFAGKEERYQLARVELFGRQIPVLVYTELPPEQHQEALAHALLDDTVFGEVWRLAPAAPVGVTRPHSLPGDPSVNGEEADKVGMETL